MQKPVIWSARAATQLNDVLVFIRKESPRNAETVKEKILAKIEQLSQGNVVHRIDPYKQNNLGNFRFFVVLKYRISYYESDTGFIIIRIRHESMEPKRY